MCSYGAGGKASARIAPPPPRWGGCGADGAGAVLDGGPIGGPMAPLGDRAAVGDASNVQIFGPLLLDVLCTGRWVMGSFGEERAAGPLSGVPEFARTAGAPALAPRRRRCPAAPEGKVEVRSVSWVSSDMAHRGMDSTNADCAGSQVACMCGRQQGPHACMSQSAVHDRPEARMLC